VKGALLCRCQPGDNQRRLLRPGGAAQVKLGSPPRLRLLVARRACTGHRRFSAGAALLSVPATSRWKSRGSFPRWAPSRPCWSAETRYQRRTEQFGLGADGASRA